MPLSNEELRLLEQMERALHQDDPAFAATMAGLGERHRYERDAILASIVFVLGIVALISGTVMRLVPLGLLGFVLMVMSGSAAVAALRTRSLLR